MNENQEFERINQKTRERTEGEEASCKQAADTLKAFAAKRRKTAVMRMSVTAMVAAAAWFGILGLQSIGWINGSFCFVLLWVVLAWLAFKAGYHWHEIKKSR